MKTQPSGWVLSSGSVSCTRTARWFTDGFAAAQPQVIEWRKAAGDGHARGDDDGCKPRLNRLIQMPLPGSELVVPPILKRAMVIEATDQVAPHVRRILLAQSGRA